MARDKPVPGKFVNETPKIDMKGIVGSKSKNLAGPPRSAGLNPKKTPGKQSFDKVRHITGSGNGKNR